MKLSIVCFLFLFLQISFSQITNTATLDTTGGQQIGNTSIGGYLDLYYGYNLNDVPSKSIPYFVSSHRNNELNVNLAFVDIRYQSKKVRARIVPGFGTYMNQNYAAEPGSLRNLVEASAGFKLSKKKNIWMDAGILGSPYTNESAISKDHLMYTRSLAPEYVPYYLSGLKFSFPVKEKLNLYLYILNGWQQIRDQNNGKSIGTQLEWRPNSNNLINWNTYVGDERSSNSITNRMRYFSDIYWLFNAGKKWNFTSCIYVGRQDQKTNQQIKSAYYWWQANFIAAYAFTVKISLSGRVEYFSDPDQMILDALDNNGFNGGSLGLCFNFKFTDKSVFRLDARHFYALDSQFEKGSFNVSNQVTWLTGNITIWF